MIVAPLLDGFVFIMTLTSVGSVWMLGTVVVIHLPEKITGAIKINAPVMEWDVGEPALLVLHLRKTGRRVRLPFTPDRRSSQSSCRRAIGGERDF